MTEVRIPRPGSTSFEVLKAIVAWWAKKTYGPSVDQIRQDVGLRSKSSVQWHVDRLVEDDLLSRSPKRHESLKPTEKGKRLVDLFKEVEDA